MKLPPPLGARKEYCPKCGYVLEDGSCLKCSRKRQLLFGILLWMIFPLGGFMACVSNFQYAGATEAQNAGMLLGMGIMAASVPIGLILFVSLYLIFIKNLK